MYDPGQILSWLESHVKPMRQSRRKTLAVIVAAALRMKGVGVLALGRAMAGAVGAKHCIKRVWRFLRNPGVECESVSRALWQRFARSRGRQVVLVDWTDLHPFQQLVFALPRDGRALPFLSKTIRKADSEGSMVRAEEACLDALGAIVPSGVELVLIGDRGFGNTRWLTGLRKRGWHFVQRLASNLVVDVQEHLGQIGEIELPRGTKAKDWGRGLLTDANPFSIRLVSTFAADAREPWYLATDLECPPPEVVRLYQRRMWIEEMFRDLKNRNWGLGLDAVRLSSPERHDRLFVVLALAYAFLCAFGAAAETLQVDRLLKANTTSERVINLARLGNYFLQLSHCTIDFAIQALLSLPP